jgi:hypothetical protein
MSMMGDFREVTPGLLARLKADPSLTEAVVLADYGSSPAASDMEVLLNAMPPKQREMMKAALDAMTPEQRSSMEITASRAASALRGVAEEVRARAKGEGVAAGELGERVSLDKAWHGLHYLLSGSVEPTPEPLGQVVLGGTEIGGDHGYGPARYLEPAQVREIAAALAAIDRGEMSSRFDPKAMDAAGVYPGQWHEEGNLDWLLEALDDLTAFYESVAARGNAVLLCLR